MMKWVSAEFLREKFLPWTFLIYPPNIWNGTFKTIVIRQLSRRLVFELTESLFYTKIKFSNFWQDALTKMLQFPFSAWRVELRIPYKAVLITSIKPQKFLFSVREILFYKSEIQRFHLELFEKLF